MSIIDQVEKILRDSLPLSQSVSEDSSLPDVNEHEADSGSYMLGDFEYHDPESPLLDRKRQHKEFSYYSAALLVLKSHASRSEWKQFGLTHRDDWTNGFLESMASKRARLQQEVFASQTHEDVLDVLSKNKLEEFVQDFADYLVRRQYDLDEGESPGVFVQSLQSWAWFLLDYPELGNLPKAETSADIDGCLEMEWELSCDEIQDDPENEFYGNGRGLAVLTFYPASLNHLSILSGAYTNGKQRITLDCFLSHDKTIQIIDLFAERLVNPNE